MKNKDRKAVITDRIREKARELWEKDGWKQGRDLDYWLEAEKIIKARFKDKRQPVVTQGIPAN